MNARLYLLGIGPGDPELLTIKAARILSEASCVAFPQKPNVPSFALEIARRHISEETPLLPLNLPMKVDRQPAQQAYDTAAQKITSLLRMGKPIAYLCEGDPFFYGSAMYLFSRLSSDFEVEVVPGISSVNAAACALGRPLVARNEKLKILPGTLSPADLEKELATGEAVALVKTGRHFAKVREALIKTGHADTAFIVQHASGANQEICPLLQFRQDILPYFSIILCYLGQEAWRGQTNFPAQIQQWQKP